MKPVSSQVVFKENPIITGKYLNNVVNAYSQHSSLKIIVKKREETGETRKEKKR